MGYSGYYFIVAIVVDAVLAYFSGEIASKKGYNFANYALLGFFLPIVGLIVAAALPDKNMQSATISTSAKNDAESAADTLLKYKQLLDSGAITQEEYDTMKSRVMEGDVAPEVDESNPMSVAVIFLRNGLVNVNVIEDGRGRSYGRQWRNDVGRDRKELAKEIAEQIERESGRKVLYKMIVK